MKIQVPGALPTGTASLPPLGGRLLATYKLAWLLALVTALGTVGWSWIEPTTSPEILGLRLAKSAVLVAVATILFRRRGRDPVAAMLSLAFLLWTISSSIDFAASSMWAAVVDRCRFLLFAWALLLFPDGQWRPGWTRPIARIIAITFVVGIAEAAGLIATRLYLPVAIGCVITALAMFFMRYRSSGAGVQKQQLKWVTLGLVAGIALILSARLGAQFTAGATTAMSAVAIEGLFQLGIIVLALGFLISLLRYRLYDAEAAISRSAAYAGLTLALVATFAASEAIIQSLGQRYFGPGIGDLSGGIAAAIAAVLLTPLHGRISAWAEQRFQHDLAAVKRELPDLLIALSAGASVKRLAAAVLPSIERAVQATRVALLVDDRVVAAQGINLASARKMLKSWRAPATPELIGRHDDEAFPLQMALRCPLGSVRGWLLLGPRPDGSFYGKDDIEALTAIAPSLQRALVLVVEREAQQARQESIIRGLNRSMALLAHRLDRVEQR